MCYCLHSKKFHLRDLDHYEAPDVKKIFMKFHVVFFIVCKESHDIQDYLQISILM